MANDALREFYARAGKSIVVLNQWRKALPQVDQDSAQAELDAFMKKCAHGSLRSSQSSFTLNKRLAGQSTTAFGTTTLGNRGYRLGIVQLPSN